MGPTNTIRGIASWADDVSGPKSHRSHHVRTLALELAPYSIRVNTLHPTGVATDMIHNESAFRLFLPDVEHPTKEQAAEVFTSTNAYTAK